MRFSIDGDGLEPQSLKDFAHVLSRTVKSNFPLFGIEEPCDSSDVGPVEWVKLASQIRHLMQEHDFVILLHGTDSMAYTAAALSYLLNEEDAIVVLTGSQRALVEEHSDAVQNIQDSIAVAQDLCRQNRQQRAKEKNDPACIRPNVFLCFNGVRYSGLNVSKFSSVDDRAFFEPRHSQLDDASTSFGGSKLRSVDGSEHLLDTEFGHQSEGLVDSEKGSLARSPLDRTSDASKILKTALSMFERKAGQANLDVPKIIEIVPGFDPLTLGEISGRGLILKSFGAGNIPTDPKFENILSNAVTKKSQIILAMSQCPSGGVQKGRYAAGTGLWRSGVVSGGNMTLEAAYAKFVIALAHDDPEFVRTCLTTNLCGELG